MSQFIHTPAMAGLAAVAQALNEGVPAVVHSGQGGLLEVMPHPNFATNRLLYLTYSKSKGGDQATTALVRASSRTIG